MIATMPAIATRISLDEFLAIPGFDERRLELIDGEVYEKPVPTWSHGTLAGELYVEMRPFGSAAVEPRAIIPAIGNQGPASPVPDFAFYRRGLPLPSDWMRSAPTVVGEVLSPGQTLRDLWAKIDAYRAFGVQSVWVFDIRRRIVDVFEGDRRRTLGDGDLLETTAVPGLSIDLTNLFNRLPDTG